MFDSFISCMNSEFIKLGIHFFQHGYRHILIAAILKLKTTKTTYVREFNTPYVKFYANYHCSSIPM